ncbi:hypothetical protein [Limnohabitans sp. JirII-31]|uniref:hypothetical protein n=1 Tax=Limnohabitans sp. JirII-31 TaxID=1977908 RepID=UPI000C1E9D73|nr:hypothetical protein [Limnohabitans sp. JirII-31]PIT76695.1 hypothetical protein B9Z41_10390 [Limnohabitans sp. JirII-31]
MDTYAYGASHTKVTGRKVGVSFFSQPKPQPIQIEDGWMPVYCFEIQVSDRLSDYLDFSLFDTENRKHLYAKFSRQLVDSRSPILIRRIKDQLNYEISTLNVRESKPTEIRLFAFTTIEEAEAYEISLNQQSVQKDEKPKPIVKRVMQHIAPETAERAILHVTNRDIPVRVKKKPQQIQKPSKEKKPSQKSLVASQKRNERAQKREEREQESKQKVRVKTALEIAFDEAKDKT